MIELFHLYYIYGAIAAFVIITAEHIICKTGFKNYDISIIVFWPYFLIFAIVLLFKCVGNLIKYQSRQGSK
jgi:hypothetical protein